MDAKLALFDLIGIIKIIDCPDKRYVAVPYTLRIINLDPHNFLNGQPYIRLERIYRYKKHLHSRIDFHIINEECHSMNFKPEDIRDHDRELIPYSIVTEMFDYVKLIYDIIPISYKSFPEPKLPKTMESLIAILSFFEVLEDIQKLITPEMIKKHENDVKPQMFFRTEWGK